MTDGAGGSGARARVEARPRASRARLRLALGPLLAPLLALPLAACGEPQEGRLERVAWAVDAYDLALAPAGARVVDLRWRPPTRCVQVYRVVIDEAVPAAYERLRNLPAEHSQGFLALGADALRPAQAPAARPDARTIWPGRLLYWGPKTHEREVQRELFFSGALVGPASPDAACFERTWDPIDDALALGWPKLPARLTAQDEVWTGARVESRCNRSACIDPKTGGGGPEAHHLTCVTMDWRERLEGIYDLGDRRVAAITSYWSDGHDPADGIWSERQSLVDVDAGRLLASEVTIHHGFLDITRSLRIEAVDACPGGLLAAGWQPPADDGAISRALERASTALQPRKPG